MPRAEWNAAYAQAKKSARPGAETEFVRLLGLPIHADDKRGIQKRVSDFRKVVSTSSAPDLKQLEANLSDSRTGLSRLYNLELSTTFRNELLKDIRSRIGKDEAGVSPPGRATTNRLDGTRKPKAAPAKPPATRHPDPMSAQRMLEIGPIGVNYPDTDDEGRLLVPITGSFSDIAQVGEIMSKHLADELKRIGADANVEPLYSPNQQGARALTLRVSNAAPIEVMAALHGVRAKHARDLSAARMTVEEVDLANAYKAWAGVWAKFGNLYNPIPFTEFTDQGFGLSADPTDVFTLVKGVKGIRQLKGQGRISRRGISVPAGGSLTKLLKLFQAGINKKAWQQAIDKLSDAEKTGLQQLAQTREQVLQLIKLGKPKEAYQLVKQSRAKARGLYNRVRDEYWKNPEVRKEWKEAGADMSKNAPTVLVERVENGKTFFEKQTVTLEHKVRLNDNPFLAVSDTNLVKSLGYENSVLLEDIRRIEKAADVVWATDEIERLVRTIESKTP